MRTRIEFSGGSSSVFKSALLASIVMRSASEIIYTFPFPIDFSDMLWRSWRILSIPIWREAPEGSNTETSG